MATKKTAAKSATKATGTALQPWEQRAAEKAAQAAESASSTGGSTKTIGTRGGVFSIDGSEVEGDTLNLIVLDFVLDITYYGDSFDADEIVPPVASALGRIDRELVWADNSDPEFAGKLLKDSEVYQWGSADKGKGKAAKSRRRLIVVPEGYLEDPAHPDNQPRKLMVPVTSSKDWDKYVKSLEAHRRPPCGVVTAITISSHPKFQFQLGFKLEGLVDDESMNDMLDLSDSIQEDLFRPYADYNAEPAEKPARGGGKAQARGVAARKGRR
jgi:hypothetical protein